MGDTEHKKTRVLIFPCGSEIGLEIHRALCFSAHVELVGASSVVSNHGRLVFREYVEGLPYVDAPDFIDALNSVIAAHHIDLVYAAHDSVVLRLAEEAPRLGCGVIGSPAETCSVCRSKRKTYVHLDGVVRTPALFDVSDGDLRFPVFVKPDVGQGSRGAQLVASRGELDAALSRDSSLLIMEHLPGTEYTVDCFTDRHGHLLFSGVRERVRTQGGISVHTRDVDEPVLQAWAQSIHASLVFRGAWFFQAKRAADGSFVLLEVAPRVSGGMGLFRNAGVNLPLLSVFDRLDMDVAVESNAIHLEMDRALTGRFVLPFAYESVYVDLDDTLIVGGEVNVLLVAFLFQCRNRGVRVHVLSRHAGDLGETLRRFHLDGLFDRIVAVDALTCKSSLIDPQGSIFIDDSFAERKRVHAALGIPVFAPDAVESLLDWRR